MRWPFRRNRSFQGRKIFKLNEDDILEIISEQLAEEAGFGEFSSRTQLFGAVGKDLRIVSVIDSDNSKLLKDIDMKEIDEKTEFNGSHSFLENNPKFNLDNYNFKEKKD
jgi:hypothetical protein